MRTTIDIPDPLFRRVKAVAAMRGTTMKQLIVEALERDTADARSRPLKKARPKFPIVRGTKGNVVDLSGFDFDDLLS